MLPPTLPALFTALLLAVRAFFSGPETDSNQSTSGAYFGQTPPGSVRVRFAPQIITLALHSSPVFSPAGEEVFWTDMQGGGLQFMELVDGARSVPAPAPFALPYSGEPVFGPDGSSLRFLAGERLAGGEWGG